MGDGDDGRLMVGGGVDGREPVDSRSKTVVNRSRQLSVNGGSVQTLEESELLGIGGSRIGEGVELLDDNMGVSLNLPLGVELLGSREVVLLGVDEVTSLQVLDVHLDGERLVGLDCAEVLGESEFGGRHVVCRGNDTDGGRVT